MRKQENVIIAGASAGVGRAVAELFASKGAAVGLIARNLKRLESAAYEVKQSGGRALVLPADVSNAVQVESAAERFVREFGSIDIWVNCAMTTIYGEIGTIEPDEFRRVTEVSYLGYVYGTQAALKWMVPQRSGTIVQVGSILAYRSIPLQSPYCGAKHAIRGFSDSVRSELLHDKNKVWITTVHLPAVNTPQFSWCKNNLERKPQPVPPVYKPEVAAEVIFWAAHHRRREVVLGARSSLFIWGNKFFPGIADWYTARTMYNAQQFDGPDSPNRPDNLWYSVEGNFGSSGNFSEGQRTKSFHLMLLKLPGYQYLGMIIASLLLSGIFKCLVKSIKYKGRS